MKVDAEPGSDALAPIAVTMGDPAGIGPEIVLRSLLNPYARLPPARFVVYGDPRWLGDAARRLGLNPEPLAIRHCTEIPPDHHHPLELVALRQPDEYAVIGGRLISDRGLDIGASEFEDHVVESHVERSTALHAHLTGAALGVAAAVVAADSVAAGPVDPVPAALVDADGAGAPVQPTSRQAADTADASARSGWWRLMTAL